MHATHFLQTADICKCSDGQNLQITKRGNIFCNLILQTIPQKRCYPKQCCMLTRLQYVLERTTLVRTHSMEQQQADNKWNGKQTVRHKLRSHFFTLWKSVLAQFLIHGCHTSISCMRNSFDKLCTFTILHTHTHLQLAFVFEKQ